ncbi:MAG TPA: VWA domain-containing protein [Pyrinomonadaceae bacterium]|nr:VWA domain-containing protein [Pyrinomonadaceae bacterium]
MIRPNFPFSPGPLLRATLALLLCLAALPARAQPPQDEDVERVNASLIKLNIGVADRRGYPVTNLTREEFVVYEDGVRQTINSFEPASAPFSLVVLLDMSGSTLKFRPTLKQSALRFLDALSPDDRVAVVSFNDKIKTLQDFTADRRKVAYAIAELAQGGGNTNFYRGLQHALAELNKEGARRRKAVVVLTDGLDTEQRKLDGQASSSAQTEAEAVALLKPDQSPALRAVLDAADRQGVTVYPLALPGTSPRLLPTGATPQQAASYFAARDRMQTLAARTGGRLHEINRLEDMGRLYAQVAADMRTLYSITYQSTKAGTQDGKWRAINVEVTRAALIARTRPGYYAR